MLDKVFNNGNRHDALFAASGIQHRICTILPIMISAPTAELTCEATMLIEKEIHTDCTVIISEDDTTGEVDIGWFENSRPPKLIITDMEGEE